MADEYEEDIDTEVDAESDTVTGNDSSVNTISVDSMIDSIIDGDNTKAKEEFEALIGAKLNAALDVRKQELAKSIYSYDAEQDEETLEAQED